MLLQIRCFERELSNSFIKDNFIFLSTAYHPYVSRMSFVCHSYYSHVIRMSLVCTRMSFVCHLYVLVCDPYATRMYSHVIRMSLVCHPYVTRMYSYVIRMSLVCTRMSFVCHSYVVLPWTSIKWTKASFLLLSLKLLQSVQ